MTDHETQPAILILNQMAGPMTWELAEDMGEALGSVALFTGHPDTLQKSHPKVQMFAAAPYHRGSFIRRALSWVHYWLQAFFWLWRWPKETPLLLFSNPPILCWLGWLMRTLRGTPYHVMVHDIYPDVLVRMSGFSEKHPLIRLWRWLNRRAYERAKVVMTLGEYMAATLALQFDSTKTTQGQIEVIYPWVDTEKIKPIPKAENWFAQKYNQVDKLTVMYSGNMGLGHDIETMLEAARQLKAVPEIHFMFIGTGPKWSLVNDAQQSENLKNITVLGWQPENDLPYILAAADIALVSLENEFQGLAIPSKSIFAMSVGSIIISISGQHNELYTWITDHFCGAVCPQSDVNGLVAYLSKYSWQQDSLITTHELARQLALTRFTRTANVTQIIETILYE
ncbi:MAG: glycosyltransferase family 4 protein [Ardenticatenaceae bacterium]|nr:glycosyltransferase family 4 protein [Ardenticatenaceae bacterium]